MATVTLTTPGRSNLKVAGLNVFLAGSKRAAVRVVLESCTVTAMPVTWPSGSLEPDASKVRLPSRKVTRVSFLPSVTFSLRMGSWLGARLVLLLAEVEGGGQGARGLKGACGECDTGLKVALWWSGNFSRSRVVPFGQVKAWSSSSFLPEQPASRAAEVTRMATRTAERMGVDSQGVQGVINPVARQNWRRAPRRRPAPAPSASGFSPVAWGLGLGRAGPPSGLIDRAAGRPRA